MAPRGNRGRTRLDRKSSTAYFQGDVPQPTPTSLASLLRIVRLRLDRILQGAMKKSRLVPLLVALAVLGSSSIGSAIEDNDPRQWQVETPRALDKSNNRPGRAAVPSKPFELLNRQPYELYNLRRRELGLASQLSFKESKGWGGNDYLDFTFSSGGDFQFVRKRDNNPTIIKGYQSVAMYNSRARRYLYYHGKTRDHGKLRTFSWDDSPVYQWLVEEQCPAAGPLFSVVFSLYNTDWKADLVVNRNGGFGFLQRAGGPRRYEPCR